MPLATHDGRVTSEIRVPPTMTTPPLPGPTPDYVAEQRAAAERMFPEVDGRPGVYIEPASDGLWVYLSGKVSLLRLEVDSVWWTNDWLDRRDSWPDEISDEFFISEDCLTVGPGWWYDSYFGSWFVFDRAMVARSLGGDDSWIPSYLRSFEGAIPAYLGVNQDTYGPPCRHR